MFWFGPSMEVLIEKDAGIGSGFPDEAYTRVGAKIVASADEVFSRSDLIIKVKEPQPQEIALFHSEQIVFTYLHLAASKGVDRTLPEKRDRWHRV